MVNRCYIQAHYLAACLQYHMIQTIGAKTKPKISIILSDSDAHATRCRHSNHILSATPITMNRQSQYEGLPSRPHDVSSRLHQLRSTSDSQLVVRPPGESDEVVISNIFSPLNSSSESSADHDRYAATTRRDEDACLREGPFAFGSPVSVAELNIFSTSSTNNTTKDASKTTEDQAHLIPKVLKRRSRGVDSPKKTVDTRNVYVSAIVNATTTNSSSTTNGSAPGSGSKKSSLTSSLASSSSSDSVDSSASLSIHLEDLLDQLPLNL